MKKYKVDDPEYLEYIKTLPCYLCGHKPKGSRKVYKESTDEWVELPCKNSAHHVGEAGHTRSANDHIVIPACLPPFISGYSAKECHFKVHHFALYKTDEEIEKMREAAIKYYEEYKKLKGIE